MANAANIRPILVQHYGVLQLNIFYAEASVEHHPNDTKIQPNSHYGVVECRIKW